MSWTLDQQTNYSNDSQYRNRIQMAFFSVANDVENESSSATNHIARKALADRVLYGAGVPPRAASILHILNPALQVDGGVPTDNDILFTVSQQWDYFAAG